MNQPDHDQMVGMLDEDAAAFFKTHVKKCESDCALIKTAQDMLADGWGKHSKRELWRFVQRVAEGK